MAKTKNQNLFPDYVRVRNVDKSRLADLTVKAKGDRSLNDFAKLCDVNPSTISRLVNQKNNGPCADTLIMAIAKNADPDSGVTLDMLLEAFGLAKVNVDASQSLSAASAALERFVNSMEDGNFPNYSQLGESMQAALKTIGDSITIPKLKDSALSQLEIVQQQSQSQIANQAQLLMDAFNSSKSFDAKEQPISKAYDSDETRPVKIKKTGKKTTDDEFEKSVREIIVNVVVGLGFYVKLSQPDEEGSFRDIFDFGISTDALEDRSIKHWNFEVKSGVYSSGMRFLDDLFQKLYFCSLYDKETAASLVIADRNAFENIRNAYDGREIHDYISIILIDRTKREVVDEFIFRQRGQESYQSIFKK